MRKIIIVLIFVLCFNCNAYCNENIEVAAQGAVLMDFESGRVLWGKNEDSPLAMASTTKIMTAILALEKCDLTEIVTASSRAAAAPQVKMGVINGEKHQLIDLMYALMLQSSNDAAVAIAEHVGETVENFCDMMTKKAAELGCKDTVFETPNGLDYGNHHSTAYDMALITRYALNNQKFIEIINTREVNIPVNGGDYVANKNRLLNEYDGAIGVKTGFTGKAGQCFVGAAKRGDTTLISVVLASGWGAEGKEKKWIDTKKILDYGFKNFKKFEVLKGGTASKKIPVIVSKTEYISTVFNDDVILPLSEEEKNKIKIKYCLPNELEAPVEINQNIGYAEIFVDDKLCAKVDIITVSSAERNDLKNSFKKIFNGWNKSGEELYNKIFELL